MRTSRRRSTRRWRQTSCATTRSRMRTPSRTSTSRSRPSRCATTGRNQRGGRRGRPFQLQRPMSEETTRTKPPAQPESDTGNGRVAQAPCLAEGIELIGKFEDSGYKEPPYIARRADGQVVQLPYLLYAVCEQVDGRCSYDEIAERVSEHLGRGVSRDNVEFLVE